MHCPFAIAMFLLAAASHVEGANLMGIIFKDYLGDGPVPNAQVSAPGLANPTASGTNGDFLLLFPRKEPGETVELTVTKQGFVVVNSSELRQRLPRANEVESGALKLVLCRASDLEQALLRYHDFLSKKSIADNQRRLREQERARLQAAAAEAGHASGKPARPQVESSSHQVTTPFSAAKFAEAPLQPSERAALEQRAEAAKPNPGQAFSLNKLGIHFRDENHPDAARDAFEKSLVSLRRLVQQNRSDYLPILADILTNLGNLDKGQHRVKEARRHYEEALRYYQELEGVDLALYVREVETVNKLLRDLPP